ncbi:hypothetical protein ZOSMA_194G00310 [Zostera marina]|uniref:HTH La-type RNA-binding domain-containing protein n=1 Tax=Zostera marina TaxID=29655 RepID=A0A0K9PP71_ZOSMR|nr:hypothetical protein ZOSMA_194G00310 [Zostera marina]
MVHVTEMEENNLGVVDCFSSQNNSTQATNFFPQGSSTPLSQNNSTQIMNSSGQRSLRPQNIPSIERNRNSHTHRRRSTQNHQSRRRQQVDWVSSLKQSNVIPPYPINQAIYPPFNVVPAPLPMEMNQYPYPTNFTTRQPFVMNSWHDCRYLPFPRHQPFGFNPLSNFYRPQEHNSSWTSINPQIPGRHFNQAHQPYPFYPSCNPFQMRNMNQRPYFMNMQAPAFIPTHGVYGNDYNQGNAVHYSAPFESSNLNDLQELKTSIRVQIEYYFGDTNYPTDDHLHKKMDKEGWVDISEIAQFRMVCSKYLSF